MDMPRHSRSVPNIGDLWKQLNYDDPKRQSSCAALKKKVKKFVKDEVPGHLHSWIPEYKDALHERAKEFLDRDWNGHEYWPDHPAYKNHNGLVYAREVDASKYAR
ncbi:hypothetical protein ACHAQH_006083 [Verticillium albo-atrum]